MSNTKLVLFFDECHKIYYAKADDAETIAEMQSLKYDIINTSDFADFETKLTELYDDSCELRFVRHADTDLAATAPALNQYDEYAEKNGDLHTFLTDLKRWLATTNN